MTTKQTDSGEVENMHIFGGSRKKKYVLASIALVVALGAGFYLFIFGEKDAIETNTQEKQTASEPQTAEPAKDPINLQPELDKWLGQNTGTYSVVMRDLDNGEVAARHR